MVVRSTRPTVVSFTPIVWEKSVRERLGRVIASDPYCFSTILPGRYTSTVSVIASWLPRVLPYSLSIIEAPATVSRVNVSYVFAAFKKMHMLYFCLHGGFDRKLVPNLFHIFTV